MMYNKEQETNIVEEKTIMQDFEREGDFYQRYDMQKVHLKSRRTPSQPFTPYAFLKTMCIFAGVLIPFVLVIGMLSGNGQLWSGMTVTYIIDIALTCMTAIVLIGFGIAHITSTSYTQLRKKLQFLHATRS